MRSLFIFIAVIFGASVLLSGCTSQESYQEVRSELESAEDRISELEDELSEWEDCADNMDRAMSDAKSYLEDGYVEDAYSELDDNFGCP